MIYYNLFMSYFEFAFLQIIFSKLSRHEYIPI